MTKVLQLPSYAWWRTHRVHIPLLLGVLELMRAKKSKKWGDKRADCILPLKVRGKVLWLLNSHKYVSLALREDKTKAEGQEVVQGEAQGEGEDLAITDLRWFLSELSKDIQSMLQEQEPVAEQLVPHTGPCTGAKAPNGRGDLTICDGECAWCAP